MNQRVPNNLPDPTTSLNENNRQYRVIDLISSFHEKLYNRCSAHTTPVAPAAPPRH